MSNTMKAQVFSAAEKMEMAELPDPARWAMPTCW